MLMNRNRPVAIMLGSLFLLTPAFAVAAPQSRAPTAVLSAPIRPVPPPGTANVGTQGQEEMRLLELSLAQVVELALRHNLQVRVSSLNPDLAEEKSRFASHGRGSIL